MIRRRFFSTAGNGRESVRQRPTTNDQPATRPGYIFLLSVLFITAIAISIVGSYMLLSIASLQNGLALERAEQSLEIAQSCAERSLQTLLDDGTYGGHEILNLLGGSCTVDTVGGYGNTDRTLCVEATNGTNTRRLEIVILRLLPSIQISSWREVATISACSP